MEGLTKELEGLKQESAKSEEERRRLQKLVVDANQTSRKRGRAQLSAELQSWRTLADQRKEETGELEMRIVELMEANESLEEGMKGLQDEIQVMKDEADRSMSERRSAQEELKELRFAMKNWRSSRRKREPERKRPANCTPCWKKNTIRCRISWMSFARRRQ